MTETPSPRRRSLLGGLRASFLTGLVVVLPIGLTIYLIYAVVGWIDSWILPLIPAGYQPNALLLWMFGEGFAFQVRGVGVVVFLVFTIVMGWIARGLIGRRLLQWAERLVDRMPVVRSIYNGLKQIAETFFAQKEKSFDRTCLVEFPRPGAWAVGFVAARAKGEIAARLPQSGTLAADGGGEMIAVFVGLTPLMSGLLIYVPARDVVMLDMSLEDAAKLIISAGMVYPPVKDQALPLLSK